MADERLHLYATSVPGALTSLLGPAGHGARVKLPLSMSKSCFWLPHQRQALPAWSGSDPAVPGDGVLQVVDLHDIAIVGHRNFDIVLGA